MKKLLSLSMALFTCMALLTFSPAQATAAKNTTVVTLRAQHSLWYLRTSWTAPRAVYSPLKKRDDGGYGKIVVMVGSNNVCNGNYSGDIWADSNIGSPAFIFWNCPSA